MSKPAIAIACLTACLAGFGAGFLARGRGPAVPEPSPDYRPVVMRFPSCGNVSVLADADPKFSVYLGRAGDDRRQLHVAAIRTEMLNVNMMFHEGLPSARAIEMNDLRSNDGYDWGFRRDGKLEYSTTWTYRKDASRCHGLRQFYDREGKPTHTEGLLEFVKTGPTVGVLGLPEKVP